MWVNKRKYSSSFSGHGFKLAPVIGRILGQIALRETPSYDISTLRIGRFETNVKLISRVWDFHYLPMPSPPMQIIDMFHQQYRQISNISRTKSQILNASRLVVQLYLCNILKPGIKSRMKM